MTMPALDGQTAVVTGGARGLGLAIASEYAGEGASVAVLDRNLDAAVTVASSLGSGSVAVEVDVADPASLEPAAERVVSELGTPTILVNSAGINRTGPTEELEEERWRSVLDVNLAGTLSSCQVFGRMMLDKGAGAIVNLASANAYVGSPGRAAYCSSKSGVVGLTRALAVEWGRRGVRVNAIAPGYILTPLLQSCFDEGVIDHEYLLGRIPQGRLGHPREIARAAVFLASSDSAYVSGQTLVVDGGYLAYGAPEPVPKRVERAVDQGGGAE